MTGATGATLVQAFRRAALPLFWYYLVTLVLPLANGAAQSSSAFASHALVVLVVPPILIALACAARWVITGVKADSVRSMSVSQSRLSKRA